MHYIYLCQVPCPTGADISKLLTNREVTKSCKQRYTGKVPTNLFILHDDQDCLKAAQWLKENFINLGGKTFSKYMHIFRNDYRAYCFSISIV